ncbi:MAG: M48 family metallopeptidase [Rhodocyclaceae bacterium]|nr:M48 family metallopeptidase [Rhodocyclaceae bacterium]
MIRPCLAFALSASLAFNSVAAGLPDLGDASAADLSPATERRLGEQIMRDIRWNEPSYLDDPEVESYLNALGGQLVAAAGGESSFRFFAMRDPTLNAFAMPGGYIGVHTALILAARTESELAAVLAHEIAHVNQRHIARMVGKQGQSNLLMLASLLVAVLAAGSSDQVAQAAVAGGAAAGIQSRLGYTREFEREADRIGLSTLEASGFDVRGMPGFFERLQRESRLYENNAPAYLRTHPLTVERIADMENRVAKMRYRQVPDSDDFTLVQARLATAAGSAADVLAREHKAWASASKPGPAQRYGYVNALLRAGQLDEAWRVFGGFAPAERTAMIAALGAEVAVARHDWRGAEALLSPAIARFPNARYLHYRRADAWTAGGQARRSIDALRPLAADYREDVELWTRLAQAYQAADETREYHRAQAEVYAMQGLWMPATEQLELARRSGTADFYAQSAIDARLRELRTRADEARDLERRSGR